MVIEVIECVRQEGGGVQEGEKDGGDVEEAKLH